MQISSIIDITGGKLLNTPAISFITQIEIDSNKVEEGDLFIARVEDDISKALENGAFGIVYDFEYKITDDEIAWIQVNNVEEALIKLMRYKLSGKTITSFYCTKVIYEMLKLFKVFDVTLLKGNIFDDFASLKILNSSFVFSTNYKLLIKLFPQTIDFNIKSFKIDNLISHSLFLTTFSYKDRYFYKLRLPKLYINEFLTIYNFFDFNLDINRLKKFIFFNPLFIDKNLKIVSFGESHRFILANDDKQIAQNEIKFLQTNYSYANIIVISEYKDDITLLNRLKQSKFNALYIVGKSYEDIVSLLG